MLSILLSRIKSFLPGYHGVHGPVTVSRPEYHAELQTAVWKAARSLGYDVIDSNGPTQTGKVFMMVYSISKGYFLKGLFFLSA